MACDTRPECLLKISHLAQITEEILETNPVNYIRALNKSVTFDIVNRLSILFSLLL